MKILSALSALACLILVSCSATQSRDGSFLTSYEGLKKASTLGDAVVYQGDLAKLQDYDEVYIEEVKVYQPTDMAEKGVTRADLDRLRTLFADSLRRELKETRFALASGRGEKTLSIRAAITDLQPGDPKVFATGYVPYVGTVGTVTGAVTGRNPGAGSATVEAEVIDSVTREVFLAGIDRQAGSKFQPKEGMTRWGHVEAAIADWSSRLKDALAK